MGASLFLLLLSVRASLFWNFADFFVNDRFFMTQPFQLITYAYWVEGLLVPLPFSGLPRLWFEVDRLFDDLLVGQVFEKAFVTATMARGDKLDANAPLPRLGTAPNHPYLSFLCPRSKPARHIVSHRPGPGATPSWISGGSAPSCRA